MIPSASIYVDRWATSPQPTIARWGSSAWRSELRSRPEPASGQPTPMIASVRDRRACHCLRKNARAFPLQRGTKGPDRDRVGLFRWCAGAQLGRAEGARWACNGCPSRSRECMSDVHALYAISNFADSCSLIRRAPRSVSLYAPAASITTSRVSGAVSFSRARPTDLDEHFA